MKRMWSVLIGAVLGVDGRALDDRQNVALHAFARNVRAAAAAFAPGNLVDLVDEDDAVFAGAAQRFALDRVHVDEFVGFLLREDPPRVGDGHALLTPAFGQEYRRASRRCRRSGLDPYPSCRSACWAFLRLRFRSGARRRSRVRSRRGSVRAAAPSQRWAAPPAARSPADSAFGSCCRRSIPSVAERVAVPRRGRRARLGLKHVDDPLDGLALGEFGHFGAAFVADRANRGFDQVAHHRFDVAADVADFGVLRRFDFHERSADDAGQAARDLGFTDAGRARSSGCSSV